MRLVSVNLRSSTRGGVARSGCKDRYLQAASQGSCHSSEVEFGGRPTGSLTVPGREAKAVYCFPLAHYDYWRAELPGHPLLMGVFGGEFATDGLLENTVFVGDKLSIGAAEVSQPRLPCYNLGIRFESDEMVKRFLMSARTGFYVAVKREGPSLAKTKSPWSIAIETPCPSP